MRNRQPVHVLYGGGHLFQAGIAPKMGRIALKVLERDLPNAEALAKVFDISADLARSVYPRLIHKLETEPVEDMRIDFEDGYGTRSDAEEDAHAEAAAHNLNGDGMPPFLGLRIKPLKGASERRALRTLQHFFKWAQPLPQGFVVTLPKITSPKEVEVLLTNLPHGVGIELMIETLEALDCLQELFDAGQGRVTSAHFGPYDFLSSCGIAVVKESLQHPVCVAARTKMLMAYARKGIALSDGPTRELPLGVNAARALALHFHNVQKAAEHGFYQGWDLHPAQLPARYAALFAFFLDGVDEHRARLKNFIEASKQATRVGHSFDDAATVLGLVHFFERAVHCGAMTAEEAGLPEKTMQTLS